MQKGIYYRAQLKLIPLIVSIMGKKYFNRRCQGTIRIDQRRFEILLADTLLRTPIEMLMLKTQRRIISFVKRHDSHRSICSKISGIKSRFLRIYAIWTIQLEKEVTEGSLSFVDYDIRIIIIISLCCHGC